VGCHPTTKNARIEEMKSHSRSQSQEEGRLRGEDLIRSNPNNTEMESCWGAGAAKGQTLGGTPRKKVRDSQGKDVPWSTKRQRHCEPSAKGRRKRPAEQVTTKKITAP